MAGSERMRRGTARDLARRSLLPFVIAALVMTGLLGMHVLGALHATPVTLTATDAHAGHSDADAAATDLPAAPASTPGHDHGCPGDGPGAGTMLVCGMLLPAGTALTAAAVPDADALPSPALLTLVVSPVHGVGEPRPSLLELSISRT